MGPQPTPDGVPNPSSPQTPDLPRTIGFWGATAVMVGIIIGSGIFRTPASIAGELASPLTILFMWLAGGVLSLAGALTYAELAVMYPQSGGVYVFLREGYGRCTAFVFGWTYMLITKPVAAAGIAVIFGEHVNTLLHVDWDPRVSTSVILVVLTWINARGVALGTGVAGVLTLIKVGALLAIVALGVALQKGSGANFQPAAAPTDPETHLPITLLAAIAPVMMSVLWTYDGWSDVGAIAGEIREPQRQLPRIYLAGTIFIVGLYLAVNAIYLAMMPLDEMRGTTTIAPIVMGKLLGPIGATAATVVVLIATLGSTHGSILTGARVSFAQARDGLLFQFLGRVHPRYQTPAVALWSQLVLSLAALWLLKGFDQLAGTFVFTMWIFYAMAGATIFILRARHPQAPRAYRCWGYPAVPALFIISAIAMTALSIWDSPRTTLPWIGVLFAGVPVYYIWLRFTGRRAGVA